VLTRGRGEMKKLSQTAENEKRQQSGDSHTLTPRRPVREAGANAAIGPAAVRAAKHPGRTKHKKRPRRQLAIRNAI